MGAAEELAKIAAEDELIDALLAKHNMTRKKQPKDGACLFRCFAEILFHTSSKHNVVRQMCMDSIERHADYYKNYVYDSFEDYLTLMRLEYSWGGELEISALCALFQIHIVVYAARGKVAEHGEQFAKQRSITLCYLYGNHYDLAYESKHLANLQVCQELVYEMVLQEDMPEQVPQEYYNAEYDVWLDELLHQNKKDASIAKKKNKKNKKKQHIMVDEEEDVKPQQVPVTTAPVVTNAWSQSKDWAGKQTKEEEENKPAAAIVDTPPTNATPEQTKDEQAKPLVIEQQEQQPRPGQFFHDHNDYGVPHFYGHPHFQHMAPAPYQLGYPQPVFPPPPHFGMPPPYMMQHPPMYYPVEPSPYHVPFHPDAIPPQHVMPEQQEAQEIPIHRSNPVNVPKQEKTAPKPNTKQQQQQVKPIDIKEEPATKKDQQPKPKPTTAVPIVEQQPKAKVVAAEPVKTETKKPIEQQPQQQQPVKAWGTNANTKILAQKEPAKPAPVAKPTVDDYSVPINYVNKQQPTTTKKNNKKKKEAEPEQAEQQDEDGEGWNVVNTNDKRKQRQPVYYRGNNKR